MSAKRRALRLAMYIQFLGEQPVQLRQDDYRAHQLALAEQFTRIRGTVSGAAVKSACKWADTLISRKGLLRAAEEISPPRTVERSDRREMSCIGSKELTPPQSRAARQLERTCRRKVRHRHFIGALRHALELGDPNLRVYRCSCCDGLHVGHPQPKQQSCRIENRLAAIAKELERTERRRIHLLRECESVSSRIRRADKSLIPRVSSLLIRLVCLASGRQRSPRTPA